MDVYVIDDIMSYCDNNTRIKINKINKRTRMIVKFVNPYRIVAMKEIEHKFDTTSDLTKCSDFFFACCYGDMKLIYKMISEGWQTWELGLCGSCLGGNINVVKLMIRKGAWDFNKGLCYACQGGHMDIVELMISLRARDWNNGLMHACRGGHMNMVELMMSKGACDWNSGLSYACECGHKSIVELMISKGATICFECFRTIKKHNKIKNKHIIIDCGVGIHAYLSGKM